MNIIKTPSGGRFVQTIYPMKKNTELALMTRWLRISGEVVSEIMYLHRADTIMLDRQMSDIFMAIVIIRSRATEGILESLISQHETAEKIYESVVALTLRSGGPVGKPYGEMK